MGLPDCTQSYSPNTRNLGQFGQDVSCRRFEPGRNHSFAGPLWCAYIPKNRSGWSCNACSHRLHPCCACTRMHDRNWACNITAP